MTDTPSDPQVPAFLRNTPTDVTATLTFIQTQLSAIYSAARANQQDDTTPPRLDQDTYIKIYTAIFDYCVAAKPATGALSGKDLYRHLEQETKDYCRHVRGHVFGTDDEVEDVTARRLLKAYLMQHDKFLHLSHLVKNLMQFWERHWVRREVDEKTKNVFLIDDLNKMVWREEVLQVGVDTTLAKQGLVEIADAVTELRESERMADYDSKLVKDVVKSLSYLSLTIDG